ncbi:MAG: hypothetical protein AVDCRST_MAG06-2824, partial [uncultured Nocardioides sp.]
ALRLHARVLRRLVVRRQHPRSRDPSAPAPDRHGRRLHPHSPTGHSRVERGARARRSRVHTGEAGAALEPGQEARADPRRVRSPAPAGEEVIL